MTALPQRGNNPSTIHPAVRYGQLTFPDRHKLLIIEFQGATAGEVILISSLQEHPRGLFAVVEG